MKKPLLLLIFISIGSLVIAQPELPFKTGSKNTGSATLVGIEAKKVYLEDFNFQNRGSGGGGEMSETPGFLDVTASGGASYTIPIALPPGINGVQPSLSLVYNSQAGNGIAGWGWNISGVSMISRIGTTIFHDGRVGNVGLNSIDRFSFDGQRMMLKSGVYGAAGSEYETEIYSNLKITAVGISPYGPNYGPASFRVDYPDGSHAVYGNNTNSRSRTEWAITYWEDARGLRITYEYVQADNNLSISKISYGSAPGQPAINQVLFNYVNRNRTDQAFIGGYSILRKKLLSNIEVKGSGGTGYRKYTFSYNHSSLGYSRLTSLQEQSGDGLEVRSPIEFSYKNTTGGLTHTPSDYSYISNVNQVNAEVIPFDYDGDGKMEFIVYPTTGPDSYYKFWFIKDFQQQGSYSYPIEYGPISFQGIFPTEFLYSNEKKYAGQGITLMQFSGKNQVVFNIYGKGSVGLPLSPHYQKTWNSPTYNNRMDCFDQTVNRVPLEYVSGDFNGDGLTDVLAVSRPYNYVSCTPLQNPGCPLIPIEFTIDSGGFENTSGNFESLFSNKFNQSGSDSIYRKNNPESFPMSVPPEECCECHSIATSGSNVYFIDLDRRLTSNFSKLAGNLYYNYEAGDRLITTDVDGDGKTDLILVKEGSMHVYTLNEHKNFSKIWSVTDSRIKRQFPFVTGDFNGDGKSDILIPTANNSSLFAVFMSTGTGFQKFENTYPFIYKPNEEGATNKTYNLIAIDIDGDSKSDIIDYRTTTYNGSDNGTQSITPYYNAGSSISNGSPFFTAGSTVSRTGNLRHLPIPVFLPSDQPNVNLEFASVSHHWVTHFQFQFDHREETLLRKITQNGVKDSITYHSLVEGVVHPQEGIPLYETGSNQIYPYVGFSNIPFLKVVQETTRYVNSTLSHKRLFSYKGAVLHSLGLGFLGFEGVAQSNRHTDYSNRIFSVTLSDPLLRGAPIQQHSKLYGPDFYPSLSAYIEKSVNTYQTNLLPNKVFKLQITETVSENALESTITTSQIQYDAYNNPVLITTDYSGQGAREVSMTYSNSTGSPYFIGRPATRTDTRTISGQAPFTITEEWFYLTNGLVSQKRTKGNNISNFDIEDFTYDAYGNLLSTTSTPYGASAGRTSAYQYDPSHRFIIKATDVEGLETNFTYHAPTGNVLTITNYLGQVTSQNYDSWGRVVTVTDNYGKETTTSYIKNPVNKHFTISITAENGAASEQEFDPLNRLVRESYKNALGQWVHVKQEYDVMGRPWKKSEPYIGSSPSLYTVTLYDVYNRPTKITVPTGKETTFTYTGLTTTVSDGSKTTVTTKNALGLALSHQDPGGTINYTYFSNGALKTANYGGSIQVIEQDGKGRKTKLTDPSAGEYLYEYNSWGEVIKETSPKGFTEYVYDGYGKIIQKKQTGDGTTGSVPTNMVSDYSYDAVTKQITQLLLTNADGNNSTYTYTYDSYYRPLEITEENPHASFTKEYTYDSFGRILTEENTALNKSNNRTTSKIIHHTYQNGVLIRLREGNSSGNKLWELQEMNARGQITKTGLGHTGLVQQKTFDVYGLPTEQKMVKSGTELFRHNYTWNTQEVLLTSRSTTLFMHSGNSWSESFVYDAMDRLIQWTDPLAVNTQSYDDRGRIEENSLAGEYVYETITTYRQKTINLNAAGQDYFTGHQIQQVVYNNFKQPVEIIEENRDKITFQYNAAGRRSHMQWGRTAGSGGSWGTARYHNHYSTDGSMEIIEDAVDGSTTFTIYIGGDAYTAPLIWRSRQGGTTTNEFLYLHRDYLGSIVAVTDVNGAIKEKRHFDAWGNIAKLQNGSGVDLSSFTYLHRGYTGHEHLKGVGLIHMNGRLYDPMLHRFLMPDNYIQNPYNTQNFNRYGYVLNNPLLYTDPSGELFIIDSWIIGFLSGGLKEANKRARNDIKIWGGLFSTDSNKSFGGRLLEVFSRFTWQLPQTIGGFFTAHSYNTYGINGGVESVTYKYGATVLKGRSSGWGGVTQGSFIIGDNSIEANENNPLFQHEYGHYLQSQKMGWAYYGRVGIPSIMSKGNHDFHPVEQDANRRAFLYFNEMVAGFQDDASIWDNRGWNFAFNPLDVNKTGIGEYIDYSNSKDRMRLNNIRERSKWYDYIFSIVSGFFNAVRYNH